MNSDRDNNINSILRIVRFCLTAGLVIAGLYISIRSFKFLMPLFMGLLLAETAMVISRKTRQIPFLLRLEARKGLKQRDGDKLALCFYFIIVSSLIALIIWGITAGVNEIISFARSLPANMSKIDLNGLMRNLFKNISDSDLGAAFSSSIELINQQLSKWIPTFITKVANSAAGLLNSLPLIMLVMMISVMFGYYSINGSIRIYAKAIKSTGNKDLVRKLFTLTNQVINTVFRIIGGYLLLLIITFVEAYIGFMLISLPSAWIWALICAFVDILPILGISAVMIPMIIYFFGIGNTFHAIAIIVLLVVMTIARRMWEPLILGRSMRLHPLFTLLSMIVGIIIWGLSGVFLGPLYFVTLMQFSEAFNLANMLKNYISKQNMGGKIS